MSNRDGQHHSERGIGWGQPGGIWPLERLQVGEGENPGRGDQPPGYGSQQIQPFGTAEAAEVQQFFDRAGQDRGTQARS